MGSLRQTVEITGDSTFQGDLTDCHVIDGDSCIFEVYKSLYAGQYEKELESLRTENGVTLFVPNTIVFRNSVAVEWYFTSIEKGRLMRKHRSNVCNEEILKVFKTNAGRTGCDLAAVYTW
jgi:hypothetical protein